MRRDPALHDLSRDHHQLLLLARNLRGEGGRTREAAWAALQEWWPAVEAHFALEEAWIVPLAGPYGDRIRAEHARLRALAAATPLAGAAGELERHAAEVGRLLRDHVRFEEDDVFGHLQRTLAPEALRELAGRLHVPTGLQACRV